MLAASYTWGMRTRRLLLAAAGAVFALALAGCTSSAAVDGQWGDPEATAEPSLEFVTEGASKAGIPSGSYHGTDGCNRVGGSFTQDDEGLIDLGNMFSTMMYCEGVDDWLNQARTAQIDGDALVLFDENSQEIGTLKRH